MVDRRRLAVEERMRSLDRYMRTVSVAGPRGLEDMRAKDLQQIEHVPVELIVRMLCIHQEDGNGMVRAEPCFLPSREPRRSECLAQQSQLST